VRRAVMIGAGATGRGHIGLMLYQQGWHVTFVDKRADLIAALRAANGYTVRLFGPRPQTVRVESCEYLHVSQSGAVAKAVADADLVCTAVFDQNLPDVAAQLLPAFEARRAAGRSAPLHVICCENMMDSSTTLRRHVRALADDGTRAWLDAHAAFPNSMISRIVPQPERGTHDLVAEDYNEWTVDAGAMRGDLKLSVLHPVTDQAAYLERKLFIHNGGHAVCGYFGFHLGHRYIHEAVADARVAGLVGHALDELGAVVLHKHRCFSKEEIARYKADLAVRGAVAELRDEILRVVRDPMRKLSARERLVAPALYAASNGLSFDWLVKAVAAALRYSHPADAQSVALAGRLKAVGCRAVVADLCSIEPGTALSDAVVGAYEQFPAFLESLKGGPA
jgi:mannitol-1-phosphate 5-dehydrogenase